MGKKAIRVLLFSLLIGAMLHVSAWAEEAVVIGSDVNMREGPGTNFRVMDCLPEGAKVTVVDRSNGSWFQVEYDGTTGFMAGGFLEITEEESPLLPAQTPSQTPSQIPAQSIPQSIAQSTSLSPAQTAAQSVLGQGQAGYVDAMYVRFRSAPGSDYSVRGEYNRGKELTYYFTIGDWAACIIDGVPGYIYKDYVALGSFDGWTETPAGQTDGSTAISDMPVYTVPTVTPAPEQRPTAGSQELSLEHATTPGVDETPGYINANYVRFRKGPGSSYPIIETYSAGKVVGVTGIYMDWTACLIDGAFGFIYSDYVTIPTPLPASAPVVEATHTETVYTPAQAQTQMPVPTPEVQIAGADGYVAGNNVRMRSAPSMSAAIVDELSYGNALKIAGVTGDWTAVVCNGKAGYIYSQFVQEGSFQVGSGGGSTQTSTGTLTGSSLEKGQQIAWYAYQYLGCPYSWGGRDPSGFDCSGFVSYVYAHFGITLNRVAQDQAQNGYGVSASELQPGDILCFYSGSSYIGHVGIYLGYGMFVHAQNSATGVVITELAGHYSERGFEARRMF